MKNRNSGNGLWGIFLCVIALIVLSKISKLLGFLFSLILGLVLLAVLAFCVYIAFTALKGSNDPAPAKNGRAMTSAEAKVVGEGRAALTALRTANLKIENQQVKDKIDSICKQVDQIMTNLRRDPDRVQDNVQLLKYYLPQLAEIVAKYVKIQGPSSETATDEKLMEHLDMVSAALVKQFESTVSDEKVDLTAEMDAMKAALQMDGLDAPAADAAEAEDLAKKYENQL